MVLLSQQSKLTNIHPIFQILQYAKALVHVLILANIAQSVYDFSYLVYLLLNLLPYIVRRFLPIKK